MLILRKVPLQVIEWVGNPFRASILKSWIRQVLANQQFHILTVTQNQLKADAIHLVLDGVDTVSFIELNDSPIGTTNNMFVRYVFNITQHLKVGTDTTNDELDWFNKNTKLKIESL